MSLATFLAGLDLVVLSNAAIAAPTSPTSVFDLRMGDAFYARSPRRSTAVR